MKNYFEVNGVTKDTQGDILYIGYSVTIGMNRVTKYAISKELAIILIDQGDCEFRSSGGGLLTPKQRIIVVNEGGKKYLRTVRDGKQNNNLDRLLNLPEVK